MLSSPNIRQSEREPGADLLKGADFARRALEVAGDDPSILVNAAFALAYFGEDIDAMITLVDRALALNPSFARGWHLSGVLRLWAGQPDIAIDHLRTALRLSPRARTGWSHADLGAAYFVSRRFNEAVPELRLVIQLAVGVSFSRRVLRPHGAARRSTRGDRAAASDHPCRCARR